MGLRWPWFMCITLAHGVLVAQEQACTLRLSGQVLDDHDRSPLGFAMVRMEPTGRSMETDERGRFGFDSLCPGPYVLHLAHMGCAPVERKVLLRKDEAVLLYMEHHAEMLEQVEVVRKRADEHVGHAREALEGIDMERASGSSITGMLQRIPGVNSLSNGPTIGKPVIHGLSGNRILMLNQGIRQEDQQWGNEHAPLIDPFSTDRITVVKGAASVQYGTDALGGVVVMEPVELPREAGLNGNLAGEAVRNGRGGGLHGMLENAVKAVPGLAWRVQASGRARGDSEAPGYVLSNTGFGEMAASASAGWRNRRLRATAYFSRFQQELGLLKASHIGNITDLRNAINSDEPWYVAPFTYVIDAPKQVVRHDLLKAEAAYRVSELDQLVLTYARQVNNREEFDVRRGGRSSIPVLDLVLVSHTADLVFKHFIGQKVHGRAGISASHQNDRNVPGTGVRPLIPDHARESAGVFVIEHVDLEENLELEVGARAEVDHLQVRRFDLDNNYTTPEHRYLNQALSAGANWALREHLHVRANIASAYRPPNVSELYSEGLHQGSASIEVGNDALKGERSLNGTLDVEGEWLKGRLSATATLYANRIADYTYLRPSGYELTIRGAFPVFRHVATDAWLHGLDIEARFKLAPSWTLRNRTSLVRGRDLLEDEWLFLMPADRTENALVFHKDKCGGWKDLELGATSTFVLEQTRYPAGLDFSPPPEGYHLVGLTANINRPTKHGRLYFGIEAANLLNTAYRDYMDRFRYYTDARGVDLSLRVGYSFGEEP